MIQDKIFLDKDGTIRDRNTFELLGQWFRVAETIYWIPKNKQLLKQ